MATEHAESVAEEKKKKVGKPIGDPIGTGCPSRRDGMPQLVILKTAIHDTGGDSPFQTNPCSSLCYAKFFSTQSLYWYTCTCTCVSMVK